MGGSGQRLVEDLGLLRRIELRGLADSMAWGLSELTLYGASFKALGCGVECG